MTLRLPPAPRIALGIALVLLAIALFWEVAYWTRLFATPAAEKAAAPAAAPSDPRLAAEHVTAARLFGAAAASPQPDTSKVSTLRIKLKGVFAGRGEGAPGYAIVNSGAPVDDVVKVGADVLPGVALRSVYPTHVVLSRSGVLERVNFEEKAGAAPQIAQPALPRSAPAVPGARAPVGASRIPAAGKSDGQQQAGRARANAGGGITIDEVPSGSVAAKLGLQPGDVVFTLNGQPVGSAAELTTRYAEGGAGSAVAIEGSRGGEPLNLMQQVTSD